MFRGVHVHGVVVWAAATEVDRCWNLQRFSQKYRWNISEGNIHNIHNILSSRHRGWSLLQHAKISWKMHLFGTFRMEAMTILDAGNMATFETLKDYEWFSDEILSHLLDLGGGGGPGQGQPGPPPRCLPNALPRRQPLCQGDNFGLILTSPYFGNIFHRLSIALLFSRRRWALAVFQLMTSCPMRSEFLVREAVKKWYILGLSPKPVTQNVTFWFRTLDSPP